MLLRVKQNCPAEDLRQARELLPLSPAQFNWAASQGAEVRLSGQGHYDRLLAGLDLGPFGPFLATVTVKA